MTYQSKPDWCALAGIAMAIAALLLGASYWIAGPVLLVLLLCAYPQSYESSDRSLLLRDAVTRRHIPYRVITSVAPASRRRIKIRYGLASHVTIAPVQSQTLLADIEKHSPHLVRQGDELVLRDRYVEYSLNRLGGFRIGMGRE